MSSPMMNRMLGFLSAATVGATVKANTTASATKASTKGFIVDAFIFDSFHSFAVCQHPLLKNDPNRFDILDFDHCDLFVICDLEFFTET
jgi:hypothetical protein